MKLPYSKKKIYSNIVLKDCNNKTISRIGENHANWYIKRGLAEKIKKEDGTIVVKLNFEPEYKVGDYSDLFKISHKENRCVVCGIKKKLTRHHIIPVSYRKHISKTFLENYCHDVVPLCVDCHKAYEKTVLSYRIFLDKKYNVEEDLKNIDMSIIYAYKSAKVLMHHYKNLPENKKASCSKYLKNYLGRTHNYYDLVEIIDRKGKHYKKFREISRTVNSSYIIAKKLNEDNVQEFFEGWRSHFVENSQPKFMLDHWSVERKVKRI